MATKTAKQKLRNYTRYLGFTLDIYRDALSFANKVVYAELPSIEMLPHCKTRINHVEDLIHATATNICPQYAEFDRDFCKFPSYLRRAVISKAIGHVSSHFSAVKNWEAEPSGDKPAFQQGCDSFPVFYKGNMSKWIENGKIKLKLFTGKDWIWFILPFEPVKLSRFPAVEGWVRQNPMVVNRDNRWQLHFPFEKKTKLPDKDFKRPVLSIDLGINCTATASEMASDGTVLHRAFIDYGREKDLLKTTIGRIAVKSTQTWLIPEGEPYCRNLWDDVRHLTDEIAHQCSAALVRLAQKHNCQAIVFEHLGKLKVPKGVYGAACRRRKFHYWLQGRIQKYTTYKAHAEGIRISRVLARGTSANAFDGSGKVWRLGNKQIALFRNEKTYNCDLSASYNIGARYWIREIVDHSKSLAGNSKVAKRGQMPDLVARHEQTLASLISLVQFVPPGDSTSPMPYSGQGSSSSEETATIAAA